MTAPHANAEILAPLLAPLTGASTTGEDMSFSPEFDALDEARREDDPSLDQGDWVTTLKVADWRRVIDVASSLLSKRTKDLRVAARYTEASGRLNGFAGLALGLDLCSGLLDAFPDTVHPLPEDADAEERAGAIGWMLQRALEVAKSAPLVHGDGTTFSWDDHERARSASGRFDDGEPHEHADLALAWEAACRTCPLTQLQATRDTLDALAESMRNLDATAERVLGDHAPSLRMLRDLHERIHHLISRLITERGGASAIQPSAPANANGIANASAAGEPARPAASRSAPRSPEGMSRAEAVAMLVEVAAYFRRTEPHSPVAYLADKAATWANMPLHDWLRQVVKDDSALAHIDELLGVQR
ncbi:type VI secretion system protein TssA [Niveibacterium sp. 24ML]|uniref:type VI secretion system protein TssA n=1 Tax=Niveibacterium sp. 24ML TaxID=2985512 RepID=UPI0022702AFD|nr:type VI secretion system protein TssA [Niveibacterium sp. 24ML]MCX9155259.1 type VI secretion system protein TssA [Niveibacterium sp. 24ML]